MTSYLSIALEDRILFFSDAAAYEDDGTIIYIGPKVIARPEIPALIAVQGSSEFAALLSLNNSWRDFDHLLGFIEDDARRTFEDIRINRGPSNPPHAFIWLAGWSEKQGRYCTYVLSYGVNEETGSTELDVPLTDAKRCFFQPNPSEEACRRIGWSSGRPGICITQGVQRIVEDSLFFMQAQRITLDTIHHRPTAPVGSRAGGYVQMTDLSKSGIWTQVVYRWPDYVGEKIDPEAGLLTFTEAPPPSIEDVDADVGHIAVEAGLGDGSASAADDTAGGKAGEQRPDGAAE